MKLVEDKVNITETKPSNMETGHSFKGLASDIKTKQGGNTEANAPSLNTRGCFFYGKTRN